MPLCFTEHFISQNISHYMYHGKSSLASGENGTHYQEQDKLAKVKDTNLSGDGKRSMHVTSHSLQVSAIRWDGLTKAHFHVKKKINKKHS